MKKKKNGSMSTINTTEHNNSAEGWLHRDGYDDNETVLLPAAVTIQFKKTTS